MVDKNGDFDGWEYMWGMTIALLIVLLTLPITYVIVNAVVTRFPHLLE